MAYLATLGIFDTGARFRVYILALFGIVALASVMFWRMQTLLVSEYVEFPSTHKASAVELGVK